MFKRLLLFLYKILEKINKNTDVALDNLRQHLYYMDFEDRNDDVYIVTFLKSGTTWMQVIVYNLLTDGNMDFDHIYDVSPWPQNEAFRNLTPERVNSLPSPRILKSHNRYEIFNENCKAKFVFVYRDGKDVAVSLFHHNKNYRDPELTFESNFDKFFLDNNYQINWFAYNKEWLENKHNLDVLFISYEQLKTNFDNTIKKIATFLNVELTEEIFARVKKHASFEYMKQHEEKFGEKPPEELKHVYNQFIRNGKIGEGETYLSEEQKEAYNIKYNAFVKPYLNKTIE